MIEKTLTINRSLYEQDIVKNVIYRNAGQFSPQLNIEGNDYIISFSFETITDSEWTDISNIFHRDLIDQDLRKKVFEETEVVRNLILANAFSNAPIGTESDT